MSALAMPNERSSSNCCGLAAAIRWCMEALILAMVALAPWAFGAVHPASILILYLGLSATLVLWSVLIVIERGVVLARCPVLFCLAGMVALGLWQLVPLGSQTLAAISPSTASLRSELYPHELEALIGEEPVSPPRETISLDPNVTRDRVVQLLALVALFAVVRFAVASPASYLRFAIVCTINGALLSLLALAQRFSSSPEIIYWNYPSLGSSYGPFVCRNNFSDYANVCLCLGIGLILRVSSVKRGSRSLGERLADLSQNPTTLWLLSAVGLMIAGIMFSMSRGGIIAMAGAAICCLALALRTSKFGTGVGLLALVVALTIGGIAWFGVDAIGERMGTLADNDPNKARRELWSRTVPLAGQFPVWGTGFGTFETVEPQTRQPGDERTTNWEHAHNDYLETLIEGGSIQFLLLLLTAGFAFRAGLRAFNRLRSHPDGALAIGGLAGLTAIVLHSFGDFGMHIPAVAVLVTVLLAQLTALGDSSQNSSGSQGQPGSRWMTLAAIAACVIIATILPVDGWFQERADHYRLAAVRAGNRLAPGDRDTVIRYLATAVDYAPHNAAIRLKLAEIQYEEYLARRNNSKLSRASQEQLVETYLRPALRNYLLLRAANPLYAQAHARLAGNRQYLQHADSVRDYLNRATRLRPTEEGLWYLSGLDRVANGELDAACADWRRSLDCSPTFLSSILPLAIERLGAARTVDSVMPTNPELLCNAANLPPLSEKPNDRRSFAERASTRISDLQLTRKNDLHARAWLLRESGRNAEAVAAYEAALMRFPESIEWRFELASLLFEKGRFDEAEQQLRQVLKEEPELEGARELNASIVRARTGIQ